MKLARSRSGPCHLVSVVNADGQLRFWPLWWGVSSARHGDALLDLLPGKGSTRIRLGQIPVGGVHVDCRSRRVGVWYTDDPQNVFDRLPTLWPGWQTECWDDRYEEHVARCAGALSVPELDLAQGATSGRDWVRKRVFASLEDALEGGMDPSPLPPPAAEWSWFEHSCDAISRLYTKSA